MDTPHGAELVTIISPDAVHILHTMLSVSLLQVIVCTSIKIQNPGQQTHERRVQRRSNVGDYCKGGRYQVAKVCILPKGEDGIYRLTDLRKIAARNWGIKRSRFSQEKPTKLIYELPIVI